MKNNKQSKPTEELYLQVWRNPIYQGGLLRILTPEDWQTLTGLAMFMDEKGECYPRLETLGRVLGLNNVASVSRRISSLEAKSFENTPILTVVRSKEKNDKGIWQFAVNKYKVNPLLITIFASHPKTLTHRQEQMEKVLETRQKLMKSFDYRSK